MEKICFVVCQYGKEVNGGAEIHCKMLAERLSPTYEVDILTTKIVNYNTFEEYYTQSKEEINGINVIRFSCRPYDRHEHGTLRKKSKWARKLRRTLFRIGLLEFCANIIPKWNFGVAKETEMLKTHGFYSPDLLQYLEQKKKEYKAIIVMSYPYPSSIFGALIAPHKTILIPTAHNEGDLFRSIQTNVFTAVANIAFNTEEERALAKRIFGKKMAKNSIVAVGVETDSNTEEAETVHQKFNIDGQYMHFFGRVCDSKMGKLIPWFVGYKAKYPGDFKLVLTGRLFQDKVDHPDIIYTGFVSEEEKIALIKSAAFVVNPSKNESLSLLLLEAMKMGKTALVNGQSDVMKGHCIKSDYAANYYTSQSDFEKKVHAYVSTPAIANTVNGKAIAYVNRHYNWDNIMATLKNIIETL